MAGAGASDEAAMSEGKGIAGQQTDSAALRHGAMATFADLEASAGQAARLLKLLANERRLIILCRLIEREMTVNALAEAVGLSQSALSQHLAKLREDGLVTFRREGTTLHYRIADATTARVIGVLKDVFCAPLAD